MAEDNEFSPSIDDIDPLTIGELISLAEAAEISGLTAEYLRATAVRGRLRAKKVGRNWITTRVAVEKYLKTRKFIYPKSKTY